MTDQFEAMEHLKYDNNISENEIYQIYEKYGKELDTLPAEHLYVLRNTAFTEANMDIIINTLHNLGRKFINSSTDIHMIRLSYDQLVQNQGLYARMSARAIRLLDNSMKYMNDAGNLLKAHLKREEEVEAKIKAEADFLARQSGEINEYDPRDFDNFANEIDELQFQISTNYANTLLRRRVFIQYDDELIVEDGGVIGM